MLRRVMNVGLALGLLVAGLAVLAPTAPPIGAEPVGAPAELGELRTVNLDVDSRWRIAPVDRARQLLLLPGFRANVFASGLPGTRFMTLGPDGDVYVTQITEGRVARLRDIDGDGVADQAWVFAEGLNRPHGLAFKDNWLYVGETHQVVRLADFDGDGRADQRQVIVPNLPGGEGHFTRTVVFGPDGMLYVSIGSSCNNCVEGDERRAAILQFAPDGSGGRIFARGLRNAVGLAFEPDTGHLWATDNGRDRLGDNYPPDELDILSDGAHYGWPYCHGNQKPDPEMGRGDICPNTMPPAEELQAHSAALGLTFYTGRQFPVGYIEDIFIAFHGSWNRSEKTGYKIVRVFVTSGAPHGYENFAAGWLESDGSAWGRPVDVLVARDGTLLVSDDRGGVIYRIWYAGS